MRRFFILASFWGCTSATGDPPCTIPKPVSYARDVAPLFRTSCGLSQSCHGKGAKQVFLGAEGATAEENGLVLDGLLGVTSTAAPTTPYIAPADPMGSFLVQKLLGTFKASDCPDGCGNVMPPSGSLSRCDIDRVSQWIREGAAKN